MRFLFSKSTAVLVCLLALLASLIVIDQTRGGPATILSRCNLMLARVDAPAADVLIVGSSRSGVALDPLTLQDILQGEIAGNPTVERMAMGNITLRSSHALLDTYLVRRGAPEIVLLEASFMTPRTVTRLAPAAKGQASEHYLFGRDVNLMTFGQLLTQPAVAMPYTETENLATVWRLRLRGTILRAGALVYQFAKAPFEDWSFSRCGYDEITREATWPKDFSFTYGDFKPEAGLPELIAALRTELATLSTDRTLKEWQVNLPTDQDYPYDIDQTYREGEMAYLTGMARMAAQRGAQVIVLPMPLYGYTIDPDDMVALENALPDSARIFDLYAQIGMEFNDFWYDDAHLEKHPTALLTTALMAEHVVDILGPGAR